MSVQEVVSVCIHLQCVPLDLQSHTHPCFLCKCFWSVVEEATLLLELICCSYFAFALNWQNWQLHPLFPSKPRMTHSVICFPVDHQGDQITLMCNIVLILVDRLKNSENMGSQRETFLPFLILFGIMKEHSGNQIQSMPLGYRM